MKDFNPTKPPIRPGVLDLDPYQAIERHHEYFRVLGQYVSDEYEKIRLSIDELISDLGPEADVTFASVTATGDVAVGDDLSVNGDITAQYLKLSKTGANVWVDLENTSGVTWRIRNNDANDRLIFSNVDGDSPVNIDSAAVTNLLRVGVEATDRIDIGGDFCIDGGDLMFDDPSAIVAEDLQIAKNSTDKLGFYGATTIAQPGGSATTAGFTQNTGTNVKDDSTFTGNLGTSTYTVGGLVRRLKQLGLIAQ